jgi:hypothetical protein
MFGRAANGGMEERMTANAWLRSGLLTAASAMALAGCGNLTREEAAQALDEAQMSSQAAALTSTSVEITTDFTIGMAVESAAAEIRTFVESQLPCAEVTLAGATLTIEYGARPGACTYRGHTFSGSHAVTVMRNDMSDVVVHHVWDELSNGLVTATGDATVTWSFANPSRRVVHEITWTRLSDGRTGTGSGDRLQQPLPEGLAVGFQEAGDREWRGERGTWHLDIDDVEMRWVDPVPQSGSYVLDTPFDKEVSMTFERESDRVIKVTIAGGNREFEFRVTSLVPAT